MFICICRGITDRQIRAHAQAGARELDELTVDLGVGSCCGQCRDCARAILEEVHGETPQPATAG